MKNEMKCDDVEIECDYHKSANKMNENDMIDATMNETTTKMNDNSRKKDAMNESVLSEKLMIDKRIEFRN